MLSTIRLYDQAGLKAGKINYLRHNNYLTPELEAGYLSGPKVMPE